MKKIITLIISVIMVLCLCGCNFNNTSNTNQFIPAGERDRFVVLEYWKENGLDYIVIRDKVTNVLYLRTEKGITVFVNDDGSPILWDECEEKGN